MKIACLTGGGDAPGLNAVLRGIVRRTHNDNGEVLGYLRGWKGVLEGVSRPLLPEDVEDVQGKGGTILLTSRTNPASFKDGFQRVVDQLAKDGVESLIAIGGEDTLGVANRLHAEFGVHVIGVPKTIDNDLSATDYTFGYDTAINIATSALDRLHTTAASHERVIVVEIMGRHAGWMALEAGMAGGAHMILIPEKRFSLPEVCNMVSARADAGKNYSIIAVAEGALPVDSDKKALESGTDGNKDAFGHQKLGGIAQRLAQAIELKTGKEARHVVLGHVQRGGPPSAFDRVLASRLGLEAGQMALNGASGLMVALRGTEIISVPLKDAVAKLKTVPLSRYESASILFG